MTARRSATALALLVRVPVVLLVAAVRIYQLVVSPLLGPVCRYAPSCSTYCVHALQTHGAVRGVLLTARRLLRCHPWAAGGWDPVPGRGPAGGAPCDLPSVPDPARIP